MLSAGGALFIGADESFMSDDIFADFFIMR